MVELCDYELAEELFGLSPALVRQAFSEGKLRAAIKTPKRSHLLRLLDLPANVRVRVNSLKAPDMADCLGVTLTASESQLIPTTSEAVIYLPISLLYPALQLTDELSDEVRSHLFENFAGELLTPWIAVDYPGSLVLTMEYFGENLNGELSPLRFCAKELAEFASTISPLNSNTVDTESTGTEELFGTPQRDNDGNLAIRTAGNALFRQSGEIPSAPEVKNYLVEHGLTKHGIDVEHGKHGDIVIEGRPISKDAFRTRYQRMLKRK